MPNDLGGDPLPDLAFSFGVDGQGEVRVCFDIDKTGANHQAPCIQGLAAHQVQVFAHGHDAFIVNGHIDHLWLCTTTIKDLTALDQNIAFHERALENCRMG